MEGWHAKDSLKQGGRPFIITPETLPLIVFEVRQRWRGEQEITQSFVRPCGKSEKKENRRQKRNKKTVNPKENSTRTTQERKKRSSHETSQKQASQRQQHQNCYSPSQSVMCSIWGPFFNFQAVLCHYLFQNSRHPASPIIYLPGDCHMDRWMR